jgi:ribosomal protein S18 acetylase RimI-like enzyme
VNEIIIRHVEPSDYPPIITVVDEWWGGRRMADMLPRLFFVHFRPTSFIAEYNEEIVGFLIGFVSHTFSEQAYIHFVGIHPEFRKKGLARALYKKFFDSVLKLGCRSVHCVTSPINKGSIRFHRRMGFTAGESEKLIDGVPVVEGYDGQGEDRVLFSRIIEC